MKCHGMLCVDGGVPVWSLCLNNRCVMSIILTLCLCFY